MITEINSVFDSLASAAEPKAVIIASAQMAAFSRGAKIELFLEATEDQVRMIIDSAQALILKIHRYPQPVIAAVDGFAVGGGMELIMGCDYRISSDRDTVAFGLPEASLGVIPAMGGTLNLRRLVGVENAKELLYSARGDIDTTTALKLGIVDAVVPPADLLAEAFSLAASGRLRKSFPIPEETPGVSASEVKEEIEQYVAGAEIKVNPDEQAAPISTLLLDLVLEKTSPESFLDGLVYEKEAICYLQGTEDTREGITAFVEERKPVFQGK